MSIVDKYLMKKAEEDILSEREKRWYDIKTMRETRPDIAAEVEQVEQEFQSIPASELKRMKREFSRELLRDNEKYSSLPAEDVDDVIEGWKAKFQRQDAGRKSDDSAQSLAAYAFADAEAKGMSFADAISHAEHFLAKAGSSKTRRQLRDWLHAIQDCPFLDCTIPAPKRGRPKKGK